MRCTRISLTRTRTRHRFGSASPTLYALLLPSFAMEFEEKYGIPVKLMECSSMHCTPASLSIMMELGCGYRHPDFYNLDNYDYHTVIEDTYVYCVDKNHQSLRNHLFPSKH